ncbi:TPA: hypothetical protein OUK35_003711 [Citrobacter freundii]|uniref:DUF4297 family anti-phage-associated protein n=1 Tax=Citrobacter sp. KTE30 TaxID=1169319 RepID=UPI00032EF9D1|nr:DUF4297 family anti-phage-associated protein [Citrobacter sp. KTE30]EOQ26032.1 hypothetical protein WC1_00683 [Citrobacter sp. KTE30]HCU2475064.1 hypothetical protein [Citrobacter freundii]
MDNPRSAIGAIKGYFYQFDKTILELLKRSDEDVICIEGVEDIDLKTADDNTAIQCKYYESTEYNSSVIAPPIRLMLKDFAERVFNNRESYKYTLYGYYSKGHDKLTLPLTVEYLKDNFLIYHEYEKKDNDKKGDEKRIKKRIEVHTDLGLTDQHLSDFINLLTIDIHAPSYDEQIKDVLDAIKIIYSCSVFEAEFYYYNNAISLIKKYSTLKGEENRRILPLEFRNRIDNKSILFDIWFSIFKSEAIYCKELREKYFPSVMNTSNFDRIFIIENNGYKINEVVELIVVILNRWSAISIKIKEGDRFCPYIYIHGMSSSDLLELKLALRASGYPPMDGYDFHGAIFNCESLMRDVNDISFYKLRFINDINVIDDILSRSTRRKEIYQFYINEPIYDYESKRDKVVKIQVKSLEMCKRILK